MKRDLLKNIGKITKLSGISGELVVFSKHFQKLNPKKNDLFFIDLDGQFVPFYVEVINKLGTDRFLIQFGNVNSERKASMLLDKNLFVSDQKVDEISSQTIELINFLVEDINYGIIGKVIAFDQNPKNPILIVQHEKAEVMIPANENIILGIDSKEKLITTEIPQGLLELYIGDEG